MNNNHWTPDNYLKQLYSETVTKHHQQYDGRRQLLKSQFIKAIGLPQQIGGEPVSFKLLEEKELDEYIRQRVEVKITDYIRIPVYVLYPKEPNEKETKGSAVLALHGHGYGSKEIVGLHADGSENLDEPGIHKNFAIDLVRKGFIVVCPELVGFGERKLKKDSEESSHTDNSCYTLASQLLLFGQTLAGLRVFECMRVIDFMMTLKGVNHQRVGCMGFSGGGLVAVYTSIIDERINATIISGYTNTFQGSIMARKHCLDNYIPSILNLAEMPELIGLIAPRPLFVEAGVKDELFPNNHVKTAIDKLERTYKEMGSLHAFDHEVFDGGHEVSGKKSYDWLKRVL
ncbi:alpha/beta hydrolase family protein [Evansella sp. AB-P1]|uniref:dienelactone hydrolase family protein n=1 Tax=Evansella sp. AB-P1 TaxID=3037653 RepID=UPI00241C6EC8|nr:alpha/beta hydrolase family protein [Evansella sp. AB-P1]MDG5787858.1 alpha/beta hydrolase family protein [Evansella sp. AB-P1]